jgi:hypothetical protein
MASEVGRINVSDVISLTNFPYEERNLFYKASGIPGKKKKVFPNTRRLSKYSVSNFT